MADITKCTDSEEFRKLLKELVDKGELEKIILSKIKKQK